MHSEAALRQPALRFRHPVLLLTTLVACLSCQGPLQRGDHPPVRSTAAGTITGRVADAGGAPLPGVNVDALPATGGPTHRAVTDERGAWRLDVPEGIYRVDVEVAGHDVERRNDVRVRRNALVTVEATLWISAICECVYYAEPEPLAIQVGQVLDEAGYPLPHARVEIVSPERQEGRYTDAEGRFRVRAPVKGARPLTASDSGFTSITQPVSGSGSGPIVFKLSPARTPVPDEQRLLRGCRCPDDLFVHERR